MMISDLAKFSALRASRLALLTIICLTLIMMTGCGKKGPVRPKLDTVPEAPREVTVQQQGMLFVLGWTIPERHQDGTKVEDLTGFRIKRLTYDAAQGCPTCRDPQTEVAEIELKYPEPAQRIGKRLYWRDLDIRTGTGYRYAIVPLTIGGHETPATMVHLVAVQPPPGPTNLRAEAGDARVSLKWDAPELPDDMELIGYNLYRRHAKRAFPIIPVNKDPLQETQLLDRGLDNGKAYEYRVSALIKTGDRVIESMASPGALITPQ
ncbi:MAG: fibronectin type III domain-containing protein [Deltaproteobacteria bacterium]|jgi:predicted small lipoprotein YifL|nr:fibronectin type III domain-containing protein [Deltaproteobacteria bacterium]MBW2511502.1 fibronectin type III domain-containing protein [Deltaproteobacteria bacterium]